MALLLPSTPRPSVREAAGAAPNISHSAKSAEAATATASARVAAQAAGLSMSLGALVAGVLLAETEYRREIEINIEPF